MEIINPDYWLGDQANSQRKFTPAELTQFTPDQAYISIVTKRGGASRSNQGFQAGVVSVKEFIASLPSGGGGGTGSLVIYVDYYADLAGAYVEGDNIYCVKFNSEDQDINLLYRWDVATMAFVEVAPNITNLELYTDKVLELSVFNGLAFNLADHGGPSATCKVSVYDLVRRISGGVGTVTYGIRRSGDGAGFPAAALPYQNFNTDPKKAYIQLNCDDLGTGIVEVWIKDTVNTGVYVETYVLPQDNNGVCGGGP